MMLLQPMKRKYQPTQAKISALAINYNWFLRSHANVVMVCLRHTIVLHGLVVNLKQALK